MKYKLQVKELAVTHLIEAFSWYESQKRGLGYDFLEEWESVAKYLTQYPENCQKRYKNFRQAMLKRFPYLVIYEVEKNNIVIYNVINARRQSTKRYRKGNK